MKESDHSSLFRGCSKTKLYCFTVLLGWLFAKFLIHMLSAVCFDSCHATLESFKRFIGLARSQNASYLLTD